MLVDSKEQDSVNLDISNRHNHHFHPHVIILMMMMMTMMMVMIMMIMMMTCLSYMRKRKGWFATNLVWISGRADRNLAKHNTIEYYISLLSGMWNIDEIQI